MFLRTIVLTIVISAICLPISAQQGFELKDGNTLVFLGDSITQAGTQPEGYITLFKLFCGVNGYDVNIINAGIGGHKSNDMLARLEKDVLAHKPDWVSFSCGVNDVWHSFNPKLKGVPLPDYKKNMTEIIDKIQQSGAKVLLLTATPIYENLQSDQNKKLADYNEFLRDFAKERGLMLCDLSKAFHDRLSKKMFPDKKLLTTDGVHMNPRGNRLMARGIVMSLGATYQERRRAENRWELVNNMKEMGE
ncbi:MAG: SGNH/GDSL hydrolase family protein [Candidatus Hinthialibacter antarcticus]|nr:SGNH/GDSL hydrolase family protein [Candidatus Hinthialibacter antarcticus]